MVKEKRPLERITLSGYKSIRDLKEFPLSRGLNVLIGANGSGKTNFIRFFELLGHMMDPNKGLQNYVATHGRADAFLFRCTSSKRSSTATYLSCVHALPIPTGRSRNFPRTSPE